MEFIQPQENEHILFVSIKKSATCHDKNSIYYRPSLYECTRKYWRLSAEKVPHITLVIGHVDGIVKEVIRPTSWSRTTALGVSGRFECEGIEVEDSEYLEKSALNLITLGQNPVNYYNV